jgi:TrmH family RNA methyltransferase
MERSPLTRAEERLVLALHTRKNRAREGLFLAEGVRIAEDALASGTVLRFAVVSPALEDTARGRELHERLRRTTTVRTVTAAQLARLAATETPQGVVLVAHVPDASFLRVRVRETCTALVLDGVQDPGNFGTLARAADAFDVVCIVALPGTVDAWNPKAVRAAAGATFRIPVIEAAHGDAAHWLREQDFRVLAADAAGTPIETVARAARTALIVGNEGAGLREETRALADDTVAIPMPGRAESLNVAIAAGILLYQLTRPE